ncbi:MAG: LLM class flavin-dependent oxidoreductase [Nakamurella sp.]
MAEISVSLQAEPRYLPSWLTLARRIEASGFEALLVGDHPGSGSSPWSALGSAAAVTERLRLGTYVSQAGVREPMHLAADAASLDILAPGRVILGVGAGHTPREWADLGRDRPSPPERAGRLVEFIEALAPLLAGETVTLNGRFLSVHGAALDELPVGRVALTVGGGNPAILQAGARRADVVALTGLGKTHPDGHRHDIRWSANLLHDQLEQVRRAAAQADNDPELEVLVQIVTATDDRPAAIAELVARDRGPTTEEVAGTPYALIGTPEQMAAQLTSQAERLGIRRYVVREPAVPVLERVLVILSGK